MKNIKIMLESPNHASEGKKTAQPEIDFTVSYFHFGPDQALGPRITL
jgi:hypothetical protein